MSNKDTGASVRLSVVPSCGPAVLIITHQVAHRPELAPDPLGVATAFRAGAYRPESGQAGGDAARTTRVCRPTPRGSGRTPAPGSSRLSLGKFLSAMEHIRRQCREDARTLLSHLALANRHRLVGSVPHAAGTAKLAQSELRSIDATLKLLDVLLFLIAMEDVPATDETKELFHRALCLELERYARCHGVLAEENLQACAIAANSHIQRVLASYSPTDIQHALSTCAACLHEGHVEDPSPRSPPTVRRRTKKRRQKRRQSQSQKQSQKQQENTAKAGHSSGDLDH